MKILVSTFLKKVIFWGLLRPSTLELISKILINPVLTVPKKAWSWEGSKRVAIHRLNGIPGDHFGLRDVLNCHRMSPFWNTTLIAFALKYLEMFKMVIKLSFRGSNSWKIKIPWIPRDRGHPLPFLRPRWFSFPCRIIASNELVNLVIDCVPCTAEIFHVDPFTSLEQLDYYPSNE